MPTQTSTITGAVQAIVFPPFETFSSCVLLFDVPSDGAGLSLRSNYHDRRGDANRRRPRITLVGASTTETCFMSLSWRRAGRVRRQGPQVWAIGGADAVENRPSATRRLDMRRCGC